MILAAALLATRFELQSNFWVNLYQRLLHDSRVGAQRSPVFDPELVAINDALSATPENEEPHGIPAAVREELVSAAPAYRKTQWPDDDRANRFWIASVEGMLHDAEAELIAEHERVYGVKWPAHVRVDVAAFAGPFGAYTTGDAKLAHTTVSSRDPSYRGFAALEMLMHESSHGVVDEWLVADRAKATTVEGAPDGLWHAILFYTSGELTKRTLATRGVTDYVPYAYAHGNYKRGVWPSYLPWIEKLWQAHIDGKLSRDDAIDAILKQLILD